MVTSEQQTEPVRSALTSMAWIAWPNQTFIELSGADRVDLLHRLTTNDLRSLEPQTGTQTVVVTEKARIIDVITVLHSAQRTLLVGSVGTASALVPWLRKYIIMDDVKVVDKTSTSACVHVIGPDSAQVVQQLLNVNVEGFTIGDWTSPDQSPLVVTCIPSVSERTFTIIGPADAMEAVRAVLQSNANLVPELSAINHEYLRVRAGLGAINHEWTNAYNPLEAGLLHLTSFTKGCYIGQEVIARLDSYNKVKQRVMGFVSDSTLSAGNVVVFDEKEVGVLTSAVPSFDGTTWMALGYVRGEVAHPNTTLMIRSESGDCSALQVLPPIVDSSCR